MVRNVLLQGAALHQAHEFLVRHVRQRNRRAPGQRVVRRDDERQGVMPEGDRPQAVQVGGIRQHADIAGARAQRIGDLVAQALLQVDGHAGMVLEKCAQDGRQVFAQRGGVAQHPHMPLQALPVVVQFAPHAVHLRQHHPRMMRQRAPRGRGLDPARPAQQQRYAQRVLHAADAFAGRGQRHVGTPGAGRNGARFLYVEKEPQVGEVESHAKSVACETQALP
ncbi:hypothetical protein D9M68_596340 [compost metagenome]